MTELKTREYRGSEEALLGGRSDDMNLIRGAMAQSARAGGKKIEFPGLNKEEANKIRTKIGAVAGFEGYSYRSWLVEGGGLVISATYKNDPPEPDPEPDEPVPVAVEIGQRRRPGRPRKNAA